MADPRSSVTPETRKEDAVKNSYPQLAHKLFKQLVKAGGPIRYVTLGTRIGFPYWRLGGPLGVIARYCIAHGLPPLQRRAVNAAGFPGSGYFDQVNNLKLALRRVQRFDWSAIRIPSAQDLAAFA